MQLTEYQRHLLQVCVRFASANRDELCEAYADADVPDLLRAGQAGIIPPADSDWDELKRAVGCPDNEDNADE